MTFDLSLQLRQRLIQLAVVSVEISWVYRVFLVELLRFLALLREMLDFIDGFLGDIHSGVIYSRKFQIWQCLYCLTLS